MFGDLLDIDFGGDTGGDWWDDFIEASAPAAEAAAPAADIAGMVGQAADTAQYISPEMDFFQEYGGQYLPGGDQMAETPLSATAQGQEAATGMAGMQGNTSLSPQGTPFGMDDEQPGIMDKLGRVGGAVKRGAMNIGGSQMAQKLAPAALGLGLAGASKLMQPSAQGQQMPSMSLPAPSRPGQSPQAAPYTPLPGTKASPSLSPIPNKVKISQGLSTRKPGYGGMSIY